MFETQIYSILKNIILNNLHDAWIHLDSLDFKKLLAEINEVILDYVKKD